MRTITACAALMIALANAAAQDATAPKKDKISDIVVINLCGNHLTKMFLQCGTPLNVVPIRGDTEDDDEVICDYGSYMFRVRNKMIRHGFFLKDWPGPILGVKMGDSREEVLKILGKPSMTFKNKEGVITDFGFDMKELGVQVFTKFDEEGKMKRVQIAILE
jgi:hypothetical protein